MKLDRLANMLTRLQDFGMDADDVMLVHTYDQLKKSEGEATIMKLIEAFTRLSPASTHKKIKKLCALGVLVKTETPGNLRFKLLERGDQYKAMLTQLQETA